MKKRLVDVIKSRRNKGFSLLEIGAALVVVGLMSAAISVQIADYTVQRKAKNAADKLSVVHEAANGYIKANYSALMNDTTGGRKVVISAGRKSINDQPPIDSLQRKGFLPSGFIDNNTYGQQHSLIIRQVSPTSGDPYLEAIVTTHGGQAIPDDQLGRVSGYVGVSGGYYGGRDINSSDANMIVGNYGGWRSAVSDWAGGGVPLTPGHVQSTLAFENGNLLTDYLYRNEVPGVPEANRMHTSIDLNSNNIRNIDTITGVAKSGKGSIVTIDGNLQALDVWADKLSVADESEFGGNATFRKNVAVTDNVTASNVIASNSVSANSVSANTATIADKVTTKDVAASGKAEFHEIDLSEAFLVMADNAGRADSRFPSANGRIKLRDLLPKTVAQYSYQVTESNPNVYKPVCGPGGEQKIMVYRQVESYNGDVVSGKSTLTSGVYAGPSSRGANYWGIRWEGTVSDPKIERTAIAQTFCSYR